jgi:hypothetical protein
VEGEVRETVLESEHLEPRSASQEETRQAR